jgi:hypothetical protein
MPLPDTIAQEDAHWATFVRQLTEHLAAQWPAMPERLGGRYEAFIEHAVQQALQGGFGYAAAVARYVNLCVVWGPSFQARAGFEWVRGLMAALPAQEWLTLHQLVRRSCAELQRNPDARIDPAKLAAVDASLLDKFGAMGRFGAMSDSEPEVLPRVACDLEAVELRVLQGEPMQLYSFEAGEWQRAPIAALAPLRIALAFPAPALIGLLTPQRGQGTATKLQARLRSHATCDGDHHPAVRFSGSHGLWEWHGHEVRAVSWPVATLAQSVPAAGLGTAIAEETAPDIHRLDLLACGLRDEGDALGSIRLPVWVWPSTQWWIEVQRQIQPPQQLLPSKVSEIVRGTTRCRVEADGLKNDASGLEAGFSQGLDRACGQAMRLLVAEWGKVAGLEQAMIEGALGVLVGRAAFSWGWCCDVQGMGQRALMRVLGQMEMQACQVDLQWRGDLEVEGACARVCIKLVGEVALRQELKRVTHDAPLLDAMLPLATRVALPVEIELEPLAGVSGRVLQAAGRPGGGLVGEVGLRPRTSGGSGWEWFAHLRLEPVTLPVSCSDPFEGESQRTLTLLPSLTLIDWSLG